MSFDPAQGGEIQKTRPAVIVSNDLANKHLNRVQVVPITSNVDKVFPSEAPITLNGRACKAAADQIRTVSKQRLTERLGGLSAEDLRKVELAILVQLGIV